ncbi:MAG: amidohydrolase family protein [Flavobacteriales bacterium]|nr:amidohydrolase family protein [Flavobacteriales bacterium]
MNRIFFLVSVVLPSFWGMGIFAQSGSTFPVNGTPDVRAELHVYEGATLHLNSDETLIDGYIAVRRGRIEAVGSGTFTTSEPAVRHDLSGKEIYPSFVDLYSGWGVKKGERAGWDGKPHYEREDTETAMGWNSALHPEFDAAGAFVPGKKADAYRSGGFGAVVAHREDGIVRGTAALVALSDDAHDAVLEPRVAAWHSFSKGSSQQSYPSSLMGSIALLRQTFCDAEWYAQFDAPEERNLSLEAFNAASDLPHFFAAGNWQDVLRSDKVGDEFGVQYAFLGGGDSYRRLDEVAASGGAMIVPVDFPSAIDVSDPYLARLVSLSEMKHWEWAPENPGRVSAAGIPMALTMNGVDKGPEFLSNVRKAVAKGLPAEKALDALTRVPAEMIGASDRVGQIAVGREANFLVCDGPLFEDGTTLHWNVVQGKPHELEPLEKVAIAGRYSLNLEGRDLVLEIKDGEKGPRGRWWMAGTAEEEIDSLAGKAKVSIDGRDMVLRLIDEEQGTYRLVGNVYEGSRIIDGRGERPDGAWMEWAALRQEAGGKGGPSGEDKGEDAGGEPDGESDGDAAAEETTGGAPMLYPFSAYGRTQLPDQGSWHFVGATVWTCGPEGKIEDGEVIVHKGRIAAVGKTLDPAAVFGKMVPELIRIDAKGKHITPGILDEHTHIAASRGINEGTQASSAEVSIGTVVNSEDVNVYRHLAGGVTAGQILHGSANPIGGQSGIIKFRWGMSPEEMKIEGADPFIKFALGENVKQSNWGDYQTVRFPQTRMGVEQVYYDHFHRAREYGEEWDRYEAARKATPRRILRKGGGPMKPRRDLELETLLQILNAERFVTCHSYRQDEINMLMHVADSMGFTLNTFTHILEGYKVADKMAEHGAGGSSFSDWWAYKFEVKDAIPYNGALLWENGVVTAFNSDDREMARRLNQEAAKAVKYGGVPEEEALKFVTLNPAKLLHLDHRMGSLEAGKDADLVVWSDHPLSIYAQCEQTYVDGRRLFDQEEDVAMRAAIRSERARLIQKMLDAPGADKRKPMERIPPHYHCDTMTEENR